MWSEETHLVWPPAGLQLMAHKLKADSEEWGPAAESRPIAQQLNEGTRHTRGPVGVKGGQKASHQAIPLPSTALTLCKPPPQGLTGVTDTRAEPPVVGQIPPNACHVTLSKPPDLSDSGYSYCQIEVGVPAMC